MKIAVIKGSPHKNTFSNMLAEQFARGVGTRFEKWVETVL